MSCMQLGTKIYLGQSSRLVRENVLNLPQIIRQIPTSGERRLFRLFVVDLRVKVDEDRLTRPHDLDRDVQRDWDDILEARRRRR
jgi:hypothetical protein